MEFESYFRFGLALIFVRALIGVLAVVARRFGLGFPTAARKGKKGRLSVVEVLSLDAKRRLVLVKRDTKEHLVLLGAAGDVVIETGIPTDDFAAALKNAAGEKPVPVGREDPT